MKKFFLFFFFLFLNKHSTPSNNLQLLLRNYYDYDKYNPFSDKENNICIISNNKFVGLAYILSFAGCIYAAKATK